MIKTCRLSLAALALGALGAAASAHTAWLEPDPQAPGAFVVRFGGHDGKTEAYPPQRLKSVQALDAQGRPLALATTAQADGVRVAVKGAAAVLTLHFDNGIWSRAEGGKSLNKPMNENPGATGGTHAIKYGKTIAAWSDVVTRPVGQPFEVLPLSPAPARAGQPWRVRVLVDGRPASGVRVARDEDGPQAVLTDADGVATFVPQAGWNKLWAGSRAPVSGDPRMTQVSIEYLLMFEAR